MKIAMLHPSITWHGGAERQLLILALELQRRNHKVEIFTTAIDKTCYPEIARQLTINTIQPSWVRSKRTNQKRTFSTRIAGRFRGYTVDLPSMVYMAKQIPKGFDLINCHNAPTHWAAFLARRKLDFPIVWNCNEPPLWYSNPKQRSGLGKINLPLYTGLDKTAVSYIDDIVANSLADAERIQKAYGRSSKLVRPGISAEFFCEASGNRARLKYGLGKDFVLLQVGNFARDKRQSESIKALFYLSKKYSKVKLVLVGQGPRDELVGLSKRLGVDQKVLFLQSCSDRELADVYAACDVFVFPAHITWGLVVLEAMASSKPVLVSKETGASEVIMNGKNGVVVEQPYAENIAAEAERLMTDAELRLGMGRNAYESIRENLSWTAYTKQMESIFQNAIDTYRITNQHLKDL